MLLSGMTVELFNKLEPKIAEGICNNIDNILNLKSVGKRMGEIFEFTNVESFVACDTLQDVLNSDECMQEIIEKESASLFVINNHTFYGCDVADSILESLIPYIATTLTSSKYYVEACVLNEKLDFLFGNESMMNFISESDNLLEAIISNTDSFSAFISSEYFTTIAANKENVLYCFISGIKKYAASKSIIDKAIANFNSAINYVNKLEVEDVYEEQTKKCKDDMTEMSNLLLGMMNTEKTIMLNINNFLYSDKFADMILALETESLDYLFTEEVINVFFAKSGPANNMATNYPKAFIKLMDSKNVYNYMVSKKVEITTASYCTQSTAPFVILSYGFVYSSSATTSFSSNGTSYYDANGNLISSGTIDEQQTGINGLDTKGVKILFAKGGKFTIKPSTFTTRYITYYLIE